MRRWNHWRRVNK